ncbi:MAG: hypothetical protein ACOYNL_04750 [Rickettsiales bacterium]
MIATTNIMNGQTDSPRAGGPLPKDEQAAKEIGEYLEKAELQRQLGDRAQQIEKIASALPLGPERDALMAMAANIRSNAASTNITTLKIAMASSAGDSSDAISEIASMNNDDYYKTPAYDSYYDYNNYSREGQNFIRQSLASASQYSEEFRALNQELKNAPPGEVTRAKNEQSNNHNDLAQLLHGPDKEKYKEFAEDLRIMRSSGLVNGPEASELLAALKNGELTPEQFKEQVAAGVHQIAEKNDKFINRDMLPRLPKHSQNLLQGEFGSEGRLDVTKLTTEWGKLTRTERDDAYKALAATNPHDDITQLPPAQQRIIAMAQVMVAAETKTAIEGTMSIIARDRALAAELTAPDLTLEQRTEKLMEAARKQGISPSNPNAQKAIRETAEAIDEEIRAGKKYDPNNAKAFMDDVKKNVRESYRNIIKSRETTSANTYNYSQFTAYNADVYSDYQATYEKNDPALAAKVAADAKLWQDIENRYRTEYGYNQVDVMNQQPTLVAGNDQMKNALQQVATNNINLSSQGVSSNGQPVAGDPPIQTAIAPIPQRDINQLA